jgi:chromosome segregation ATPase
MGVTVDAIRKRVSRRTIPHERDENGRVWVILDIDQDAASKVQDTDQPQSDVTTLISAKDETIATLREQLEDLRQERDEWREQARVTDRLLSAALERIPPQLEAPSEARESPQTVEQEPERAQPRPTTVESQEPVQRPWWRRVFRR